MTGILTDPTRAPESLRSAEQEAPQMSQSRLIHLAECCTAVRANVGRMLLTTEGSAARAEAAGEYRESLKELLRVAREEECGLFLEVAGELSL